MRLDAYLDQVQEEVKTSRSKRESKVEQAILEASRGFIEENKPSTVKSIAEALGKSTQQIHQTVKKATLVKKVKLEGRTLIVPSDME